MLSIAPAQLEALARRSVEIILANQAPSGAYLASPAFPVYRYSWLRDGAFIADAMSRAGELASAEAFFGWCAGVLAERSSRVDELIARRTAGESIPTDDFLHARYTVDGRETEAEWWDFQLDGYGAWLWALDAHSRRRGRPIAPYLVGALVSTRYIGTFWDQPSYDWWEEHAEHRHTSTLAAVYAGLSVVAAWAEAGSAERSAAAVAAEAIRSTVDAEIDRLGYLPKWLGGVDVDASLLAAATPFGLLAPNDPTMAATVARIVAELEHDGGVHRYARDTYYGGGEWLLLSTWLGWHRAVTGDLPGARRQLDWVARHARPDGALPEQVDDHLLAPDRRASWLDRWGPVATPLLWSHAMYLTLAIELGAYEPATPRAR